MITKLNLTTGCKFCGEVFTIRIITIKGIPFMIVCPYCDEMILEHLLLEIENISLDRTEDTWDKYEDVNTHEIEVY